jgi:retron-type reverse transcriptase
VSIDLSIANIWRCWYKFKRGKRRTIELEHYQYYLESNLAELHADLNFQKYKHGSYRKFVVTDNKRREISVASLKDRVVHRLLYEYLVEIYDKTFIFDAWSCRKSKGLVGAIERSEQFLKKYPQSFVWRADIRKFFNNIDQEKLLGIIKMKTADMGALRLLKEIIYSYKITERIKRESKTRSSKGVPIGNLTSQIFANIYLNELDRYVKYQIKPEAYLRYGDDFILIDCNRLNLSTSRDLIIKFLKERLCLEINYKNDIIVKIRHGLKFLGVEIFLDGRRLKTRNWKRAQERLNFSNVSSYRGLIDKHSNLKRRQYYNWIILKKYDEI